jgi:hypothetical protein
MAESNVSVDTTSDAKQQMDWLVKQDMLDKQLAAERQIATQKITGDMKMQQEAQRQETIRLQMQAKQLDKQLESQERIAAAQQTGFDKKRAHEKEMQQEQLGASADALATKLKHSTEEANKARKWQLQMEKVHGAGSREALDAKKAAQKERIRIDAEIGKISDQLQKSQRGAAMDRSKYVREQQQYIKYLEGFESMLKGPEGAVAESVRSALGTKFFESNGMGQLLDTNMLNEVMRIRQEGGDITEARLGEARKAEGLDWIADAAINVGTLGLYPLARWIEGKLTDLPEPTQKVVEDMALSMSYIMADAFEDFHPSEASGFTAEESERFRRVVTLLGDATFLSGDDKTRNEIMQQVREATGDLGMYFGEILEAQSEFAQDQTIRIEKMLETPELLEEFADKNDLDIREAKVELIYQAKALKETERIFSAFDAMEGVSPGSSSIADRVEQIQDAMIEFHFDTGETAEEIVDKNFPEGIPEGYGKTREEFIELIDNGINSLSQTDIIQKKLDALGKEKTTMQEKYDIEALERSMTARDVALDEMINEVGVDTTP